MTFPLLNPVRLPFHQKGVDLVYFQRAELEYEYA